MLRAGDALQYCALREFVKVSSVLLREFSRILGKELPKPLHEKAKSSASAKTWVWCLRHGLRLGKRFGLSS